MDAAEMMHRYRSFPLFIVEKIEERVGGREDPEQVSAWAGMEGSLVRILVEVATIQREPISRCSTLKTEETKVFLTTVIAQELVDPKLKDYEK